MYTVLVSRTFQKQFRELDSKMQDRIRTALRQLEDDPFKARSGADIKQLVGTQPPKHRIRVGRYRVIYRVEKNTVNIIEVFRRGREY